MRGDLVPDGCRTCDNIPACNAVFSCPSRYFSRWLPDPPRPMANVRSQFPTCSPGTASRRHPSRPMANGSPIASRPPKAMPKWSSAILNPPRSSAFLSATLEQRPPLRPRLPVPPPRPRAAPILRFPMGRLSLLPHHRAGQAAQERSQAHPDQSRPVGACYRQEDRV
jgi:hypothetical protein